MLQMLIDIKEDALLFFWKWKGLTNTTWIIYKNKKLIDHVSTTECSVFFKFLLLHHLQAFEEGFRIKWQHVSTICPKSEN
jgi:hypothetical protein